MWRYPFFESRPSHLSAASIPLWRIFFSKDYSFRKACHFSNKNRSSREAVVSLKASQPVVSLKRCQPVVSLKASQGVVSLKRCQGVVSLKRCQASHLLGPIPVLVFFESEPCKLFLFVKKSKAIFNQRLFFVSKSAATGWKDNNNHPAFCQANQASSLSLKPRNDVPFF